MNNSLKHLPQRKKDELAKIISTIRDNCQTIEKIILFGSYARGDYKEKKDLAENCKSGHVSDYDILVVTKDAITALHLHQSAEHAYKTILLVLTLYNPNEHFLVILSKECEEYFSELRHLFARETEEQIEITKRVCERKIK